MTLRSTLLRNQARKHGGGVASFDESILHLRNGSTVLQNQAGGHGGGIYAAGSSIDLGEREFSCALF